MFFTNFTSHGTRQQSKSQYTAKYVGVIVLQIFQFESND